MKKMVLIVVSFLLLIGALGGAFVHFIAGLTNDADANLTMSNRHVACGPLCLRIAANLYGISCDEFHVLSICPP